MSTSARLGTIAFLAFLDASPAWAGDVSYHVPLARASNDSKVFNFGYTPGHVELTKAECPEELPFEAARTRRTMRGSLVLGPKHQRYVFCFAYDPDERPEPGDQLKEFGLVLDADHDGDLSNEAYQEASLGSIRMDKVNVDDGSGHAYDVRPRFYAWLDRSERTARLSFLNQEYWTGRLNLDGASFTVGLFDTDSDGAYGTNDLVNFKPEGGDAISRHGVWASQPILLGGQYFRVIQVSPDGSSLSVAQVQERKRIRFVLDPREKTISPSKIALEIQGATDKNRHPFGPDGSLEVRLPTGHYRVRVIGREVAGRDLDMNVEGDRIGISDVDEEPSIKSGESVRVKKPDEGPEPPTEVRIKVEKHPGAKTGRATLFPSSSYDFLQERGGSVGRGTFYLVFRESAEDEGCRFFANNEEQRGLADLGASKRPLNEISVGDPKQLRFEIFGVEAKLDHLYVSPGRGAEGEYWYVIFRVNRIGDDGAIEIEYRYEPLGEGRGAGG